MSVRIQARSGVYASGEQQWLWSPLGYRPGDGRRGVVWTHGAGQDATYSADPAQGMQPSIQALAAAGFVVMCVDAGGKNTFANNVAQAAVDSAVTWLMNPAGGGCKTDGVLLFGCSMGFAVLANWVARQAGAKAKCKGMVGLLPGVDVNDVYANNRGGYQASIDNAYTVGTMSTPTVAGTAGTTGYQYKCVPATALGDGAPSAASATFNGPLQSALGATPNTVTLPTVTNPGGSPALASWKILRSVGGGGFTLIASGVTGSTYSDNVTGNGSAYTPITSPWTTYGAGGSPSYNPQANAGAGAFSGVPMSLWYSQSDAIVLASTVAAFQAAVGANCSTTATPTDGGHAAASMASVPTSSLLAFCESLA